MEKTNLKIKSTTDVERIPFNEWMNIFNVSKEYKEATHKPERHVFNMDCFKQNIKDGRILNNED